MTSFQSILDLSREISIDVESDFTTAEYLPFKGLIAATEDGAIYQINMGSAGREVKHKFYCTEAVKSFMLTAMHIVAFTGIALYFYEISDENESITVVQDLPTKECQFGAEYDRVIYTQSMQYIVGMAADGGLLKWPIKAEKQEDNEIDEENDGAKSRKKTVQIDVNPSLIGMFHNSKVVFCDEIKETKKLVAVSQNGLVTLHDLATGNLSSFLKIEAVITSVHINATGNLIVLGSSNGCIRILDLSNSREIKTVFCKKLHKSNPIRVVKFSHDQTMICFATEKSNRVYFLSGTPEKNFELYGYVFLEGTVLDVNWANTVKPPIDPKKNRHLVEVTVKNGLLQAIVPLKTINPHEVFEELGLESISMLGRRIDTDITMSIVEPETGDLFCTGGEKILRRYKQPEEYFRDMELKRKQVGMPLELDNHDLVTNYLYLKTASEVLVSGGMDGSVIRRSTKNPKESAIKINTQNYVFNGVSACSASEIYPLIYSGGFDGSLLVHSYDDFEFNGGSDAFKSLPAVADCSKIEGIEPEKDDEIKYYETILEEETKKKREDERYHTQKNMKEKLMSISNELKRLLLKNKDAQDLEKIERDEFCLDLELRQKMLGQGDKNVEEIKKDAEFKNLKEELYHKKLTMLTYSKLDTHLKSLTGLKEHHLVTNFVIRKKERTENHKYKLICNLRAVEITEKQWRKDHKLFDPADLKGIIAPPEFYRDAKGANEKKDPLLEDFIQEYPDTKQVVTKPENFICNLKAGKQKVLLLDHAKREDERQKTIAAALEYDKGSDLKDAQMEAPDRPDAIGYRLHRQNRNPKNKRKAAGAQVNNEAMEEEQADEMDNEADKDEEGNKDWELMYGAFELFTSKRKKSQAVFLKNLIFKLKRSFNREFEANTKLRNKEIERIGDLNLLIAEQMAKLNEVNVPFTAISNIIEK